MLYNPWEWSPSLDCCQTFLCIYYVKHRRVCATAKPLLSKQVKIISQFLCKFMFSLLSYALWVNRNIKNLEIDQSVWQFQRLKCHNLMYKIYSRVTGKLDILNVSMTLLCVNIDTGLLLLQSLKNYMSFTSTYFHLICQKSDKVTLQNCPTSCGQSWGKNNKLYTRLGK